MASRTVVRGVAVVEKLLSMLSAAKIDKQNLSCSDTFQRERERERERERGGGERES